MVVDEIINEIEKFFTKYKTLKTDNQSLNQFKSEVKTALTNKGIISTNEDGEVVQAITNYNPPSSGGSLDADYLKKVGLLPYSFSGTPTEKDLIVNKFIIQDPKANLKFYTSSPVTDISIELNGNKVTDYQLIRSESVENNLAIDRNKYSITIEGYYINEFSFNEEGTYKVSFNSDNLSFKSDIAYDPNHIASMDNFLIYGANLKSHKHICYDSKKIESLNGIRSQNLDYVNATLVNLIERNLDAMGGATEYFGYVYNLRTGKADLIDVIWSSPDYGKISSDFRRTLSTVIYNNKVDVMTNSYSFPLLVHGKSAESFLSDIDYKEGDTLVFAFYKFRNDSRAHKYSVKAVANYLGSLASAIS